MDDDNHAEENVTALGNTAAVFGCLFRGGKPYMYATEGANAGFSYKSRLYLPLPLLLLLLLLLVLLLHSFSYD